MREKKIDNRMRIFDNIVELMDNLSDVSDYVSDKNNVHLKMMKFNLHRTLDEIVDMSQWLKEQFEEEAKENE